MKQSKFTGSQIIKALKENESGRSVEEISRELGINKGTFYNWRKKYGGMEVSHLKRLKELEDENRKTQEDVRRCILRSTDGKGRIGKKVVKPSVKKEKSLLGLRVSIKLG